MSIRLRRPAATLPSPSSPRRHPGCHPRRFAFSFAAAAAAVAVATLLLPHAAAQPLRLGSGVPVPPGGSEEDGFAEDSSPEIFDCSTLQELSDTAPGFLQGTDLVIIKEKCDQGIISTSDEVAEAVTEFEGPNPNLDDQITIMATDICEKTSTMDDQSLNEIKEACAADPRDDEHVVDVAAKLQAQHSPTEDGVDLPAMCTSLNENRAEIEAGLTVLENRSNERRLDDSNENTVTSFNLASDMIGMLECVCDTNNPDNEGCTKKQIQFAESTSQSVMEKAEEDFASESPENALSELQSSLEKHTNHLRQKSGFDGSESSHLSTNSENGSHMSVERAVLEAGVGTCAPPGVQETPVGGYKVCLYAGSMFECEISWDPDSATCLTSECGAGSVMQLKASVVYCPIHSTLAMELKICVDVVSDILDIVGRYIPGAEDLMNIFGLYNGCYRLALAQYDIAHNRFEVSAGPHSGTLFGQFKVRVGSKAMMRFQGWGCNYDDDIHWAVQESIARNNHRGMFDITHNLGPNMVEGMNNWLNANMHQPRQSCAFRIGQWATFEITFGLELDLLVTTVDLWSTAAHFLSK